MSQKPAIFLLDLNNFDASSLPTSEVTESAPAIGSAVTKISALAIAPIRPSARSRYIPTTIKREVYRRDQGQYTFKSPDGRRCESRFLLEYDHITPFAQGGPTKSGNLRLRCRAHNLLYAVEIFGSRQMTDHLTQKR